MERVFDREELRKKAILTQSGEVPERIEVVGGVIRVYKKDGVLEIPIDTMRGKALLDRLEFSGELTQQIYL